MNWKRIVGHALVLLVLTAAGGALLGQLIGRNLNDVETQEAFALSNAFFTFLGTFIISLVHRPNWLHLFCVWALCLITSIANMLVIEVSLMTIVVGMLYLAIPMSAGNLLGIGVPKAISKILDKAGY
tara:strand:+ start:201 stop:581 length:381 start_codon:yes stop_codon:yes gene_type:complete